MDKVDTSLNVCRYPEKEVGSVNLLEFLTSVKSKPVRTDPVGLRYQAEPDRPKQRLDEAYNLSAAEGGLLTIERRGREANIERSLPLDFATLAGAARLYPGSRLAPFTTVYEESTNEWRGPNRLIRDDPLAHCVFRFLNAVNPDYSLVREFVLQMTEEQAHNIFDFDRLAEAIEAGEISSKSSSVTSLAQKLSVLERVGAVHDLDAFGAALEPWEELLDHSLRADPERLRFRWGRGSKGLSLRLSKLAEPFVETLIDRLMTLDGCLDFGTEPVQWYRPGEFDITELHADLTGKMLQVFPIPELGSTNQPNLLDVDIETEQAEYTGTVSLPPSVLPFVTQGSDYLSFGPGSRSAPEAHRIPYDHIGVLEQFLTGLDRQPFSSNHSHITVDYDTKSKLALDIQSDEIIAWDEAPFMDEYVVSQFPTWWENPADILSMAGLRPKELLGLFESNFGDIQEAIARLDRGETSLAEFAGRSNRGGEFRPELRKQSEVRVDTGTQFEVAGTRLWYDLFHPDSPVRIELSD